ncbi:hypothetical protein [Nocardiopsis ansamitocini]|uniref:Uncharacterized protein n=1 Tax=Nocardiopsis ansamitocini TaxID=1670832 RepID=A0A9W6P295_9ACTN|nr:hypothetical protein [Nocardiopsis ansamitocini]GLU45777.1 hypothetical protein Nans01_01280 [Nocardiopsis ansamitocini]
MDRYERELRRSLRWYPKHYRERHGDEIVETALELRDLDELTVSKAERRGLMWAGLATRARERPPFLNWLAYRFFNIRVPHRHRMWARDDLMSRYYPVRTIMASLAFYLVLVLPLYLLSSPETGFWAMLAAPLGGALGGVLTNGGMIALAGGLVVLMGAASIPYQRRRMLTKHDFHRDGRPVHWTTYRDPSGRVWAVRA